MQTPPITRRISHWILVACVGLFPVLAQASSSTDFEVDSNDAAQVKFIGQPQAVVGDSAVFQRCTFGMVWDAATSSCTGTPTAFSTFAQAQDAVDQLNQQLQTPDLWRIANINELRLMVPTPAGSSPTIFPVFPNTPAAPFWSSTLLSLSKNSHLGHFILDFSTGAESASADGGKYIRLVRSYTPNLAFDFQVYPRDPRVIIDVGTVNTGLMFQRCVMGMQWDAAQQQCTGTPKIYADTNAATADITAINRSIDLGGVTGWRIPNNNELGSSVPGKSYLPSAAPYILPIFPNTPADIFFTSVPLFQIDYRATSNPVMFKRGQYIRLVSQGPDVITLSVVTGPNGKVDRTQVDTVPPGFMPFQALPDLGFRVATVSGDTCHALRKIAAGANHYEISGAPSTCQVTVNFERDPDFVPQQSFTGTTQPSAGAGGSATASFTGGGPFCSFDTRASDTGFIPAPATLPADATLPQGMFQFKLSDCDATPVRMTITWPQPVQTLKKHGFAQASTTTRSYFTPNALSVNGRVTSFTVIDGLLGDDDWLQNGHIVDPVGPTSPTASAVSPVSAVPVPGMQPWLAMLLSAVSFGLFCLRRKVRVTRAARPYL